MHVLIVRSDQELTKLQPSLHPVCVLRAQAVDCDTKHSQLSVWVQLEENPGYEGWKSPQTDKLGMPSVLAAAVELWEHRTVLSRAHQQTSTVYLAKVKVDTIRKVVSKKLLARLGSLSALHSLAPGPV